MTIEEIVAALNDIDYNALSNEEVFLLSEVLKSSSFRANRVAYFRSQAKHGHDPDIMAAD